MLKSLLLLPFLILPLGADPIVTGTVELYHPEADFQDASYPEEFGIYTITGLDAAFQAMIFLSDMGAEDILVCRVQWIAAPVGGYLVDGLFSHCIDEADYSTFRMGIADGSEGSTDEEYFTFIARSETDDVVKWYPGEGPDMAPDENGTMQIDLAYEFLMDRELFENIETDFPR